MVRPEAQTALAEPEAAVVLTKATMRVAEKLELPRRDLAAILGISPASLSRVARGRRTDPASKEGELAVLLVRLFRSLDAVVGGDDAAARRWLRAPNRHLGGVPLERIRTVQGLVDVVEYLDAVRGKL